MFLRRESQRPSPGWACTGSGHHAHQAPCGLWTRFPPCSPHDHVRRLSRMRKWRFGEVGTRPRARGSAAGSQVEEGPHQRSACLVGRVRATGALDGLDRTKHLSSLDLPQSPALLLRHRRPADRKLRHSWRTSWLGQKTQSGQATVLSVGHEQRHMDQE